MSILDPAIDAYGLPVVVAILIFTLTAILTAVIDGVVIARRRTRRAAAIQRHPAGRHRAADTFIRPTLADARTTQLPIVRQRPRSL